MAAVKEHTTAGNLVSSMAVKLANNLVERSAALKGSKMAASMEPLLVVSKDQSWAEWKAYLRAALKDSPTAGCLETSWVDRWVALTAGTTALPMADSTVEMKVAPSAGSKDDSKVECLDDLMAANLGIHSVDHWAVRKDAPEVCQWAAPRAGWKVL